MKDATLTFAGAARGVTGSCYHLEYDGYRILVDCGLFQGHGGDAASRAPFPFEPRDLDAVVLTHGHLDHVGRLPRLTREGFRGEVLAQAATFDVARLVLDDGAKVAFYRNVPPLYDPSDVDAVLARRVELAYREKTRRGPFRIELFDAGHILGSSSVRIAWDARGGERAILFSGDLGNQGAPILRDPHVSYGPEDAVDYVVTESTYGDRDHPERAEAREAFRATIARSLADGGKVLIPAFAVGRTQELLYELEKLVESGRLKNIPVIVDGPMGIRMTEIVQRHRDLWDDEALAMLTKGNVPLEFRDLYAARSARASARVTDLDGPAIILAGSGMCSGGRIVDHLVEHLPDPRTDLLFVGFQAEGTLGEKLERGDTTVEIDGRDVQVRARVSSIRGFSAHADRSGLAAWFESLERKPGGRVFVTHGEQRSIESYCALLADRFGATTVVPALGDVVELP